MSDCTATLTTATVEECPHGGGCACGPNPTHPYCVSGLHITLYTIKCANDHSTPSLHWHKPKSDGSADFFTEWADDTPGATPHKPPLVSDAEVEAAEAVFAGGGWGFDPEVTTLRRDLRDALEAAAKVRMEDE